MGFPASGSGAPVEVVAGPGVSLPTVAAPDTRQLRVIFHFSLSPSALSLPSSSTYWPYSTNRLAVTGPNTWATLGRSAHCCGAMGIPAPNDARGPRPAEVRVKMPASVGSEL